MLDLVMPVAGRLESAVHEHHNQPVQAAADTDSTSGCHQRPYEAPKALFVPLQVEERLMACGKVCSPMTGCTTGMIGS